MKYAFIALCFLLSGCASTSNIVEDTNVMKLIHETAEVTPKAVDGVFVLNVQAVGEKRQIVYLNTELDYRDRRNVTIALSPDVANYIENQFGMEPQTYFLNKKIQVSGAAKQVKIWFVTNGKRTDKYYFQTHIRVTSPTQIELVG